MANTARFPTGMGGYYFEISYRNGWVISQDIVQNTVSNTSRYIYIYIYIYPWLIFQDFLKESAQ